MLQELPQTTSRTDKQIQMKCSMGVIVLRIHIFNFVTKLFKFLNFGMIR